jgi:hypothetical protein
MLQGKDRSIHGIRSYHGCYDALSYPLFFPKGELGWHNCIPKVGVTMEKVEEARAIRKAPAGGDGGDNLGKAMFPVYIQFSDKITRCHMMRTSLPLIQPCLVLSKDH